MIRLAIVDDDALIRESLKILLDGKDGITVVGLGENGLDAIKLVRQGVDVLLMDLRMPRMSGLEALAQMPDQAVLILTTFDEDEEISQALNLGAKGYLLKSATPESIQKAVLQVAQGKSVLDEAAMRVVRKSLPGEKNPAVELSSRESEIVALIARGLSNQQIAEELFISQGTVKNYISNILTKTGLEHRTQIAIGHLKGEI